MAPGAAAFFYIIAKAQSRNIFQTLSREPQQQLKTICFFVFCFPTLLLNAGNFIPKLFQYPSTTDVGQSCSQSYSSESVNGGNIHELDFIFKVGVGLEI